MVIRSLRTAALATLLSGYLGIGNADAGQIRQLITFDHSNVQSPFQVVKYKLVVSKNDGPESARYVDAATWVNGTSALEVMLDEGSKYTFKVAAICTDSTNPGIYTNSDYNGPIIYSTGALRTGDVTPPTLTLEERSAFVPYHYLELTGNVSDESHIASMSIKANGLEQTPIYSGSGGAWSGGIFLTNPGVNQVVVEARDIYGNNMSVTNVFYTDTGIDSDIDGISDFLEQHVHLTNKYSADSDGDGMNDGAELNTNFNPRDASDAVRIVATTESNGVRRFLLNTRPGHSYGLERSTNFVDWKPVASYMPNHMNTNSVTLEDTFNGNAYYRVRSPPDFSRDE